MTLHYHPIDSAFVTAVRAGGPDAYGNPAEQVTAGSGPNPCRNCLSLVPEGAPMLILAARPFPALQPYAETGPVFLCGDDCAAHDPATDGVPEVLTAVADYLLKGYSPEHRIVYGSGKVVLREDLQDYAATLLQDPRIAYVDVRSARNNCFLARITAS